MKRDAERDGAFGGGWLEDGGQRTEGGKGW